MLVDDVAAHSDFQHRWTDRASACNDRRRRGAVCGDRRQPQTSAGLASVAGPQQSGRGHAVLHRCGGGTREGRRWFGLGHRGDGGSVRRCRLQLGSASQPDMRDRILACSDAPAARDHDALCDPSGSPRLRGSPQASRITTTQRSSQSGNSIADSSVPRKSRSTVCKLSM